MPRPKKSNLPPTRQTFSCPVQGCRTQVRSRWGFTQHVTANHHGMNLQYPGNEDEPIQFPSSDLDQTSSPASPPPLAPPNTFSQDELQTGFHTHSQVSDWDPSDFNLEGNAEPIDLDPSESELGNDLEGSDSDSVLAHTEFHPLIKGMCINSVILQHLNE